MTARRIRRFVDDLLRGRRTQPFHAQEDELAELRTAILLRSARPGTGAPSEEFLSDLHRRLAAELNDEMNDEPGATITPVTGRTRRRFMQGASVAAAVTIGAVGERILTDNTDTHTGHDTPQTGGTLSPRIGEWRTVAASSDVAERDTRAFDLGSVTGFVNRTNGRLGAVSGTCTHMGCQLMLNTGARQLDCPCHDTSFSVTGELLHHQLPVAPGLLPHLGVRELDGTIQVFAPPPSAH